MKLHIDPVSLVVLSVLLGWGWYEVANEPICPVEEVHDGKVVHVPYKCSEVLTK